jgi:WhiB family transcriptional regulator, redox-sensing transcriptional regulator
MAGLRIREARKEARISWHADPACTDDHLLPGVLRPSTWTVEALCQQVDPDAHFPEKGASAKDAKKVCAGCTVRVQCLDYAIEHQEQYGVWGGLNYRERLRVAKQPGRAARPIRHGTEAGYAAHRRRGETPCEHCAAGASEAARARKARSA